MILGWNQKGKRIIEELDNYVANGSEVFIMSEGVDLQGELKELKSVLKRQKLTLKKAISMTKKRWLN